MNHIYKFEIFNKLSEKLKIIWLEIEKNKNELKYYQSFEWNYAIKKYLLPEDELIYIVVKLSGKPIAIFSFQQSTMQTPMKISIPVIQFPAHDHIPLSDCICLDFEYPRMLTQLIDFVSETNYYNWDLIKFDNTRQDSDLMRLQKSSSIPAFLTSISKTSSQVLIGDTFEESTRHISKKFLKNVRRLHRKAISLGELELRSYVQKEEKTSALAIFLEMESKGWKGQLNTAISCSNELTIFYQYIVKAFNSNNLSIINVLFLNEIPIASQIGVRNGNRLSLLKIAYSEDYKNIGPGNIILTEIINKMIISEKGILDFVTAPKWADNWKSSCLHVHCTYIFKDKLKSKLIYWLLKIRNILKE